MFWLVQENLFSKINQEELIRTLDALTRIGVRYQLVKIIPFGNTFEPEPDIKPSDLVMVSGSTTMARIAGERGYRPGRFDSGNFSQWKEHYGEHLLNYDSRTCRFADVVPCTETFFIRPHEDTKTFTGFVTTADDFLAWQHMVGLLSDVYATLTPDTLVTVCSVKDIYQEYRFFVIDGRIVTGSTYKRAGELYCSTVIDDDVLEFANQMVQIWQPDRGFVIDIARLSNDELKIVELNNLNSSGFYSCDVMKIVAAIESMEF